MSSHPRYKMESECDSAFTSKRSSMHEESYKRSSMHEESYKRSSMHEESYKRSSMHEEGNRLKKIKIEEDYDSGRPKDTGRLIEMLPVLNHCSENRR